MADKNNGIVTLAALLDKAHTLSLVGIKTKIVQLPDERNGYQAIHHATVTLRGKDGSDLSFDGTGDAMPSNVTSFVKPHIIRMAETRAIARALRWATNTGKAAEVEMGPEDKPESHQDANGKAAPNPTEEARRLKFVEEAGAICDKIGDLPETPHKQKAVATMAKALDEYNGLLDKVPAVDCPAVYRNLKGILEEAQIDSVDTVAAEALNG